jgi:hypothetical protein
MLRVNEEVFNFKFTSAKEITNRFCNLRLMSIDSHTQQLSTAVKKGQGYTKNFATGGGEESFQDWKRDAGTCMEDSKYCIDDKEHECMLNDDNEASLQQSKKEYTENIIAMKDDTGYKFLRKNYITFSEVKESQNPDNSIADNRELHKNKNNNNEVT